MIVLDASACVEILVGTAPDATLIEAFLEPVYAPAHLDLEVLSTLRGLTLGRVISREKAEEAITVFYEMPIVRQEIWPLAWRVWELREEYTSYDAAYLALAEAFKASLYTCDKKLPGRLHSADVRVFTSTQ